MGELSSPKGWPIVCLSLGLAELRPGHRASVDYPPTTARGGEGGSCPACNPRFCTPGPLLSSRRLLVPLCWSFSRPGGAGVVISTLRRSSPPVPECSAAGSRIVMLLRLRILSVPSLPCSFAPLQPCGRAGRQARACSPVIASCSFQPSPLARKTYGGGLAVFCAVISSYCFVSSGEKDTRKSGQHAPDLPCCIARPVPPKQAPGRLRFLLVYCGVCADGADLSPAEERPPPDFGFLDDLRRQAQAWRQNGVPLDFHDDIIDDLVDSLSVTAESEQDAA